MSIEKAKEQEYYPSMKIKKQDNDRWTYRGRLIIKEIKERKKIMKKNHDDSQIEHPGFKETLWRMMKIVFWDIMRKNVFRHMQECIICQLEGKSRKQELGEEVEHPEKIWKQMSIDHIMKFLRIKDKNSIIVI